jgi:putative endonuclease
MYYIYILASRRRALYIGITRDLADRVARHRAKENPNSFTAKYNIDRLVYFEEYTVVKDALAREKELKGWRRGKKIRLIERVNLHWQNLAPATPPGPSLRSG